ncbi:predicted protein [Botrytis cinerea T4]|uniref:Uncharacterized protein n=1 Tax=Botryotinia fuckeliana (strain T4) TaxID=999810 RepID=G2Y8N8_BOTF4|nr:predicted protein [Botrytis cinerea T4]
METIVLTIWSHPLYPEHRAGEHEDARLCAGEIGRGFAAATATVTVTARYCPL